MIVATVLSFASCNKHKYKHRHKIVSERINPYEDPENYEFYENLLDSFLIDNFSKKWNKRTYINTSIKVKNVYLSDTLTNTYGVSGTFSFEGRINGKYLGDPFNDRDFLATVKFDRNDVYYISFKRKIEYKIQGILEKQGGWDSIPITQFIYHKETD